MMTRHIFRMAPLALVAGLAGPQAVSAQQGCAPRDAVVSRLADRFGEVPQSIGLTTNNHMIEVFAAPETGSWTITVTTAGGLTCLLASGQAWEAVPPAATAGQGT